QKQKPHRLKPVLLNTPLSSSSTGFSLCGVWVCFFDFYFDGEEKTAGNSKPGPLVKVAATTESQKVN
ncbi:MAG TPA: hypothetical protein VNI36_11375, partial [Candidatus Dormibacteraeota bacterium]|nr:hypothetical protein [Candidatus Dormibacteraeota bacterium]